MLSEVTRSVDARARVDVALAEAVDLVDRGVLLVVEPGVPVPLFPKGALEVLERQLPPGATLHLVSTDLFAVVSPAVSLVAGFGVVEAVREHLGEHGVPANVGLAAWPVQGSTTTELFGAAVVALVDDRGRVKDHQDPEVMLDVDGRELSWAMAGELLTA